MLVDFQVLPPSVLTSTFDIPRSPAKATPAIGNFCLAIYIYLSLSYISKFLSCLLGHKPQEIMYFRLQSKLQALHDNAVKAFQKGSKSLMTNQDRLVYTDFIYEPYRLYYHFSLDQIHVDIVYSNDITFFAR